MPKTVRHSVLAAIALVSLACGCRSSLTDARKTEPQVPTATTNLTCLVKSYQQDGSCYVTRQAHDVAASADYIKVSGVEPEGPYAWQLSMGLFTTIQGSEGGMKWVPAEVLPSDYCQLVLACLKAEPSVGGAGANPVRILGNWAYPVTMAGELTWYASSPSVRLADIVVLRKPDGSALVARGFSYGSMAGSKLLPARVELYWTRNSEPDRMLLELDYLE
jgi:hypothetical protein